MEGGGQADAVSQALQQLQDALETAASTAPAALLQDLNAKLSQLSIHMHVLLQRHAVLGQSYADRYVTAVSVACTGLVSTCLSIGQPVCSCQQSWPLILALGLPFWADRLQYLFVKQ